MKQFNIEIREHEIVGESLLIYALKSQPNGFYRCELFSENKRTNQQNKYMHVVFTLLQRGYYDMGYEDVTTMEKAKIKIKQHLLSYDTVNTRTGEIYTAIRDTSELSKEEGIEFIDQMLQFAAENLGVYIPTTEEYKSNPAKWSLTALAV